LRFSTKSQKRMSTSRYNNRKSYLRAMRRFTKDRSTNSIESIRTGKNLGLTEDRSFQIEQQLLTDGFIREYSIIPGNLQITDLGNKLINFSIRDLATKFSLFWRKNFSQRTSELSSSVFYGLLFFLFFLVLEKIIVANLNKFFVIPIISLFRPGLIFNCLFAFFSLSLIYSNRKNKSKTWDIFLILLYAKYALLYSNTWVFWNLFSYGRFNFRYVDVVLIYYGVLSFYSIRRNYLSKKKKNYPEGFFNSDLPIERQAQYSNLSIAEIDKTGLNRIKFANQIADTVTYMSHSQAFAIGICGPWGTGKTSLISLIVKRLQSNENSRNFIFLEFSPWFFSNSEMLIISFFTMLEKKFRSNKSLSKQLKAYGNEIAMVEKSILKTDFSKLLFDEKVDLKDRYLSIIDEIKNEDKLIIITIDDLDRLDKTEIVSVFKLIRLIADFPNTFYIVAYDRDYINSAIEQELTKYNPDKYRDKIFNVEFKIPEITSDIIKERLKKSFENHLIRLGGTVINQSEFNLCFMFLYLDKFIRNERDIKRFANNFIIRYVSIKDEVNFYQFFLLELIYYKNIKCFSDVYEHRSSILSAYHKQDRKIGNQIDFTSIFHYQLDSAIEHILQDLFKKDNSGTRFGIANRLYFYRYFTLGHIGNDFSTLQFEKSFEEQIDSLPDILIEFNSINSALLATKLHDKFKEYKTANSYELIKIIDALLYFYNSLYYSKDENSLMSGVNTNNLGNLIFGILNNSDKEISFLEERLLSMDTEYYLSFSQLISFANIYRLSHPNNNDLFVKFRSIQLKLLENKIKRYNARFEETIIVHIQALHSFIPIDRQGIASKEFLDWFLDNVIVKNIEYIKTNIDEIIRYISKFVFSNGELSKNVLTEIVKTIFHDVRLGLYRNDKFESFRNFYWQRKIRIENYEFRNQIPRNVNFPRYKDDIFPDSFELRYGNEYHIVIKPIAAQYWRFGFRFSMNDEFPVIEDYIKTPRHRNDFPIFHLSKGQPNSEGAIIQDDRYNAISLSFYSGEICESEILDVIKNYIDEPIKISIFMFSEGNNSVTFAINDREIDIQHVDSEIEYF
jgi:hypothetical protein